MILWFLCVCVSLFVLCSYDLCAILCLVCVFASCVWSFYVDFVVRVFRVCLCVVLCMFVVCLRVCVECGVVCVFRVCLCVVL